MPANPIEELPLALSFQAACNRLMIGTARLWQLQSAANLLWNDMLKCQFFPRNRERRTVDAAIGRRVRLWRHHIEHPIAIRTRQDLVNRPDEVCIAPSSNTSGRD